MRKLILSLTMVLMFSAGAFAADWHGWHNGLYLAPKVMYGYVVLDDMKGDYDGNKVKKSGGDSVFGGGIAVGYDFYTKFAQPFRVDMEYIAFTRAQDRFDKDGMKVKEKLRAQTLLWNAYVDFYNVTRFTPYVNFGIGIAFLNERGELHQDGETIGLGTKTETNFAWNIGAGFDYALYNGWDIGLAYRFAGLGEARAKSKTGDEGRATIKSENVYMHQAALTLRYTF